MGFWKLICSIWAYKNGCRGFRCNFSGMFKNTFQETLLIPVHAGARDNHKSIRNEGFCCYLNKANKINSAEKVSLRHWLQGVFSALCDWNEVPVDGTDVAQSVVDIGRYLPLPIDLSSARSR